MKRLWSALTDNMNRCVISGYEDPEDTPYPKTERHHVFSGANKKRSELYGYIVPLRKDLHPNGVEAPDDWKEIDLKLKRMCQAHYEMHHGTREEFIAEFGRSYL